MPWIDIVEIARRNPPSNREVEQVLEYRRRKAKPKFYADENLPITVVKRLRGTGVQVLTAQQVGLTWHSGVLHSVGSIKRATPDAMADAPAVNVIATGDFSEKSQKLGLNLHGDPCISAGLGSQGRLRPISLSTAIKSSIRSDLAGETRNPPDLPEKHIAIIENIKALLRRDGS